MAVAAISLIVLLMVCASETKEKFDRALAKEVDDAQA
jgi:hypothetical protein